MITDFKNFDWPNTKDLADEYGETARNNEARNIKESQGVTRDGCN